MWTSHEALVLDYEIPLLRTDPATGRLFLGSTHWPGTGERTRQVEGAHIALLAQVSNPVACKIGRTTHPDDLLALCERLDPRREPGRLTLIVRMGAHAVAGRLPRLVRAVRGAGHGLHLETTPDDVTECATGEADLDAVGDRYTSHCDPRLNPSQAMSVVSAWTA
ncbi:hypothetical protein GCM10022384_57860 [Streptomyces marokkonensis]|uniref:Phospho-2-dehydro-3-deoxyheptonate aldolase n=1 Tax=Streptomyces marokkonensis TaxID=324855 RepID=A0ABP7RXM9_9ACTN